LKRINTFTNREEIIFVIIGGGGKREKHGSLNSELYELNHLFEQSFLGFENIRASSRFKNLMKNKYLVIMITICSILKNILLSSLFTFIQITKQNIVKKGVQKHIRLSRNCNK